MADQRLWSAASKVAFIRMERGNMSISDLASVVFGLVMGILWLAWTVRLFWIVTGSLWRRKAGPKPEDRLSASDVQFLRSLHIRLDCFIGPGVVISTLFCPDMCCRA